MTYAIISYIYKWVITFFILYWMANFLKPYKLEVISTMLAALALGSMIGWPKRGAATERQAPETCCEPSGSTGHALHSW